jgi:hypothetical protein
MSMVNGRYRQHRPVAIGGAIAVAISLASGCSAPASSSASSESLPSISHSPSVASSGQAQSRATYAVPGYVLGVAPISGATPVCPFEVATWDKSLLGNWTTVSVSARGPVELSTTASLSDGGSETERTSVAGQDSETLVDLKEVAPDSAQRVVITASDGPQGKGGTCEVWSINRDTPAGTAADVCNGKPWPLAVPKDVLGLRFDEAGMSDRELSCFNISAAISTVDGHNVANDPANQAANWIVVGVSPAPGAIVDANTPINVQVKPTS